MPPEEGYVGVGLRGQTIELKYVEEVIELAVSVPTHCNLLCLEEKRPPEREGPRERHGEGVGGKGRARGHGRPRRTMHRHRQGTQTRRGWDRGREARSRGTSGDNTGWRREGGPSQVGL